MLGQAWESSEGTVELLFIFEVANYTGLAILAIIAGFFTLSIILAVASGVRRIQCCAFHLGRGMSIALDFIAWVAFIASWASSVPELPQDQWWSAFLFVGGFVLVVFLLVRMFLRAILLGSGGSDPDAMD